MESQVIYADTLVRITEESILFRWYYFPLPLPKRVFFSTVDHVEILAPGLWHGSETIWGWSSIDFMTWAPLDFKRRSRDAIFVMFQKHTRMRIGFTVEHSKIVRFLLQERGLLGPKTLD